MGLNFNSNFNRVYELLFKKSKLNLLLDAYKTKEIVYYFTKDE